MKPHVIGAARLGSGQLYCAATSGTQNTIFIEERGSWRPSVGWSGHELTACCACGDTIVCAALDDEVYLIDGTAVARVSLPEKTRTWVYGACAITPDAALLGGAGGLFLLSVRDRTAVRKRLSEFNVSRPGRNIHGIARAGERTLILGAKNLLVDFRGDAATEPVPRDALRGREVMLGDAVDLDGTLWISAREQSKAILASLDGRGHQFHDAPETGQALARLGTLNGELFVAGDRLSAGRPGAWRDLPAPGLGAGGGIVAVVPVPESGELCAISSNGRTFSTDGHACRATPIF